MKFTSIAAALAVSASASTVTADSMDTVAEALRMVQLGIIEADVGAVNLRDNVIELVEGYKNKLSVGYEPMLEKMQKGKDDAWLLIYGPPLQRGDIAPPDVVDIDEDEVEDADILDGDVLPTARYVHYILAQDGSVHYFQNDDYSILLAQGKRIANWEYMTQIIADRDRDYVYMEMGTSDDKQKLYAQAIAHGVLTENYRE